MSGSENENPDDNLADALAAYDDRLAAGIAKPHDELDQAVDPALLNDWNRLTAFLSLVEKAWPRGGHDSERLTISDPSNPADVARAQAATFHATAQTGAPDTSEDRRFGRFQILQTLGQGGFGIVFLAWDPTLRRQVALKVPQPETLMTPEARKRFQREAHAAAGLDHPNIVPVYETGSVGSVTYIAAAYCSGPTVADWLARQRHPVPARDAAILVATLAWAVEHAHERGVLHRDLKPSNILLQHAAADGLARDDNDPLGAFEPRITDFSLARIADGLGPDTRSGVPLGSPPYMAPEQAEGKLKAIGPPTDVYGLGCILFEILSGSPPFRGEGQLDTLRQVIADAPIPLRRVRKDVSVELDAIVLKCLEKDPTRRFPSARDLAADLDRFLSGKPTRTRPPGRWEKAGQWVKRRPAALGVLLIAMVFAVSLLSVGYWYETQLRNTINVVRKREVDDRQNVLAAGRAQYVANIRQTAVYISKFQPHNAIELLMRQLPRPGEDDLREFSWHHLLRRCHTERRTLTGHRGEVYYVEFSPRGDLLASAGKDGTVRLWNTTTWQQVRVIQASLTEVNVATFSPDGKTLATVDDSGKLELWEIDTGKPGLEKVVHTGDAVMAQFTPDGKSIVTAGRTDGVARIWDRSSGALLATFPAEGAILSTDGSILATLARAAVSFWSVKNHALIGSFPGGHGIAGGAFSHDGTKLATASEADRVVRLWDVASRRMIHEFKGHTEGVMAAVFSADDQMIISAGDDNTIRFWDAGARSPRGIHLGHTSRIWNLALSPDGQTIASASRDGTIKLWNPEAPGDYVNLPVVNPFAFGFEPDSRTLLTLEAVKGLRIARWDARTGALIGQIPLDMTGGGPAASAFSNDGRVLATADSSGSVMLWDTTTGRRQGGVDVPPSFVNYLEFSPDGRHLLIEDPTGKHEIWEIKNRHLISVPGMRLVPGRKSPGVAFAPSGELVVLLQDRSLVRWNPSSGQTRPTSLGRRYYMDHFIVSSDGRFLAAAEPLAPQMHIWSIETDERHRDLSGHTGGDTRPRAFSPDGKSLASSGADQTVKIWDVATGEELLTLEGFSGPVQSCRFSPDGKILVTLSSGAPGNHAEIFLWRTALDSSEAATTAR
jgi:eukaryotic-like serine/threonine-protein kinase